VPQRGDAAKLRHEYRSQLQGPQRKSTPGFGRLLGLDRAPEVKTLTRRLTRLAAHHSL
jgi:hypothetical protein